MPSVSGTAGVAFSPDREAGKIFFKSAIGMLGSGTVVNLLSTDEK